MAYDFETLALNQAGRPGYASAFLYQPYPRTELGEYAREHGYAQGSVDEIDDSAWERSVLTFASPAEKRQIENFNKLFALAVEWPTADRAGAPADQAAPQPPLSPGL